MTPGATMFVVVFLVDMTLSVLWAVSLAPRRGYARGGDIAIGMVRLFGRQVLVTRAKVDPDSASLADGELVEVAGLPVVDEVRPPPSSVYMVVDGGGLPT